ncbi:MAG TPA: hypothetical protein DCR90_01045 [Fusobacteriaceae bacterium]|nr:hypothetical protein [Fusobacteriaceae bacterium]
MYKLTILLLTIFEAEITYLTFYTESLEFFKFLILHGLVGMTLFFSDSYNKRDSFIYNQLTIAVPFIGIFLYLMDLLFLRKNGFKIVEDLFDFEKFLDEKKLLTDLNIREELKLVSAIDTMNIKGVDEKKEFITKFKPQDMGVRIRVLKKGLEDKDIEVVHYSAVEFNQLSENFEKQLRKYKKKYKDTKLQEDFYHLIVFYKKYMEVGILDGEILSIYREDYIELLKEKLLIDDKLEDHLKILDMYLISKKYSEIEKTSKTLLEKYPKDYRVYEILVRFFYEKEDLDSLKEIYSKYKKIKTNTNQSNIIENIIKICGIMG